MGYPQENLLLQACRTLFGPEIVLSREFLTCLQPNGAKVAYRSQVKVHHPDRFADSPPHVRQRQTERFREIHQAYDLLKGFLDRRQKVSSSPPRPQPHPAATQRNTYKSKHRAQSPPANRPPRIPAIPLEFGMYAYYSGKISYKDLIQGLIWQRRQRPALGAIAKQWGWLTETQVQRILKHHGPSQRFGRKAVELRHLRPHQVDALISYQRSQQQKLGQFFVERGLISQSEANQLARKLEQHNTRLRNQV